MDKFSSITEEIINEVTMGRLVAAAKNSNSKHASDILDAAANLKPSTMKLSANKVKEAARKSMAGRKYDREFNGDYKSGSRYQTAKSLSKIGESDSLSEEIINEVSMKLWGAAAEASREGRKAQLDKVQARKAFTQAERDAKKKDESKALERNERAINIDILGKSLKPKDSTESANKVRKEAIATRRRDVNSFNNKLSSQQTNDDKDYIRRSNILASPLHGKLLKNDQYVKESSEIRELIESVVNAANALFEVETSDATQVEPSSNKLKQVKKDKNGDRTEVVSVADELFPKDGNAKEQQKQKILDIINGMIEGSNTLDDLMHAVQKSKSVK